MKHTRRFVLFAVASLGTSPTLGAASRYYVGPADGTWNTPADWSATPAGAGGATVPAPGDSAFLNQPVSNTVRFDGNYTSPLGTLFIEGISGATMTLTQSANTMMATNEYVGDFATGAYTQSAGTNAGGDLFLGFSSAASGTYSLSGSGSLSINGFAESIGVFGSGAFIQTGGTHHLSGDLDMAVHSGASGDYQLSGTGSLAVDGDEYIGDNGTSHFEHTAATNTALGNLYIAYSSGAAGTYALSGSGSLSVDGIEVVGYDGAGTFTQTGGTNTGTSEIGSSLYLAYDSTAATGTYSLSGGTLTMSGDAYVGYAGTGIFVHTGGTCTLAGDLFIGDFGDTNGTYALSGSASLSVAEDEVVGVNGIGSFIQNGGTNDAKGDLLLGYNLTTGAYSLSAGTLTVEGNEYIGYSGAGNFAQTGGTHTVAGTLNLAISDGAAGTYTLAGGQLTAAATAIASNGLFNFTHGSASLGNLSLTGTGRMTLSPGRDKVLVVSSISIDPTATADLSDNAMIVNYTGLTPRAAIRALLTTGYNAGSWNGNALTSSAAQSDIAAATALGYAEASDLGITTFTGQPVSSAILVKYTWYGDANLDGKVDLGNDFSAFLDGLNGRLSGWEGGDYNYDGSTTIAADFPLFLRGFHAQGGSSAQLDAFIEASPQIAADQKSQLLAAVPEPCTALGACTTAAGFLFRRRREISA